MTAEQRTLFLFLMGPPKMDVDAMLIKSVIHT